MTDNSKKDDSKYLYFLFHSSQKQKGRSSDRSFCTFAA